MAWQEQRSCFDVLTKHRLAAGLLSKQPGNALRDGLARTEELLWCVDQASLGCRASKHQPGNPLRDGSARIAELLSRFNQASLGCRAS
jgi:hypothetical protein